MAKYRDVCGGGKRVLGLAEAGLDKAHDYAAELVDVTIRLHPLFKRRLVRERMAGFYETVERPLAGIVAEMERAGIKVDRGELSRLSEDFAARMLQFDRDAYTLAGHEFNIGSPKQIGDVLVGEIGLEGGMQDKNGANGIDSAILSRV